MKVEQWVINEISWMTYNYYLANWLVVNYCKHSQRGKMPDAEKMATCLGVLPWPWFGAI